MLAFSERFVVVKLKGSRLYIVDIYNEKDLSGLVSYGVVCDEGPDSCVLVNCKKEDYGKRIFIGKGNNIKVEDQEFIITGEGKGLTKKRATEISISLSRRNMANTRSFGLASMVNAEGSHDLCVASC